MIDRYLLRYLFLWWFVSLDADHKGIDIYFAQYHKMKMYLNIVEQRLGAKFVLPSHVGLYDNALIGTKTVSDFICNCISMSTTIKTAKSMFEGNVAVGLVLATYSLFQGFAQIWHNKKEYRSTIEQMRYTDMMVQYPHLVLIEYQIKLMNLLIEMCCHGTIPEQIFARIHLVSMVLSGPYERHTKKQAKKLYKNYFNKNGHLISIEPFNGKHPFCKFHRKVSNDWHQLVLYASKYPTICTLLFRSPYADLVDNDYNQILLDIVDAGMHGDMEQVEQLCCGHSDFLVSELHSFYALRIET